jgi:hypothetical protein
MAPSKDPQCVIEPEVHGKDGVFQVSFREPTLKATSAFVTATAALGFDNADYNGAARKSAPKVPPALCI